MSYEKRKKADKDSSRIGRLDISTMGYYRRVSDTLKDLSQSKEDKELLLNNVFKQLCKEALQVSQNQTVSNIVEELLRDAKPSHLLRFMNALGSDWETASTDRFASHVTQTLLTQMIPYMDLSVDEVMKDEEVKKDSEDDEESDCAAIRSGKIVFVELFCFVMSNLCLYMQHTYASHIIRVILEVLAGTTVSEGVIKSKMCCQYNNKSKVRKTNTVIKVPKDFEKFLFEMTQKIINLEKLQDHAENFLSNPVLQTALLVLKHSDPALAMEACKTVTENTNMWKVTDKSEDDRLPHLVTHRIGSRLVEQVINVAREEMFDEILERLKEHLVLMSVHPVANFILQRLISNVHTKEQFEVIYKALTGNLEDILANKHFRVVFELADGCLKHGTNQEKLLTMLMKAFHCYKPHERQAKIVPLIATMTVYEIFFNVPTEDKSDSNDDKDASGDKESVQPMVTQVNLHGSIILQKLLNFGNPKLIVSSLLDMKPAELKCMTCDPCGSHVIEAFVKSKAVGEKSRTNLYNKLKGMYVAIGCNKYGSRTLETLWEMAPLQQRILMAEDLCKKVDRLQGDKFGQYFYKSCALGHFIHRRPDWKDLQKGQIKKRKLFQDIIGNEETKDTPKKKPKISHENDPQDDQLQNDEEIVQTASGDNSSSAENKLRKKFKKKKAM